MASWIEELFPPKFKVNDLCNNDCMDSARRGKTDKHIQKVYEDVFVEMSLGKKRKDKLGHCICRDSQFDIHEEQHSRGEEGSSAALASSKVTVEPSEADDQKQICDEREIGVTCIWSEEELKVLRNTLKCSKLNNIRLTVLTQAIQKDCERVKNICHEQANEILKLNSKYSEVRKQNKAMKITCKAFKDDAKKSQENLKECQSRLEDAIREKELMELETVKSKYKLEVVQKQNKVLQLEVEKQKALLEKRLENQNVSLRSLYEKDLSDLIKRLEEAEVYLEKEINEHAITKKALAQLRLHFTGEGS